MRRKKLGAREEKMFREFVQRQNEFVQKHRKKYDWNRIRTVRKLYDLLVKTDGKYIKAGVHHIKREDDWFFIRLVAQNFISMDLAPMLGTMIGMSQLCHIWRSGKNVIIDLAFRPWDWVEK